MDKIVICTDGACRGNQNVDNKGAWAYTLSYKGKTREKALAVRNTTNNIMEMTAILEALRCIKPQCRDMEIELLSDSNYCIQGLTTWRHGWKKKGWVKSDKKPVENKELWIELDALVNTFSNLKFIKVKGHSGHIGNERVDKLCNLAMDSL